MNCPNCKKEIENNSAFCEYCGEKIRYFSKNTRVGVWLGITGFVAWLFPIIGFPLSIVGLVKSIKGHSEDESSRAVVAIILNSITMLLTITMLIVSVYLFFVEGNDVFFDNFLGE